MTVVWVAEKALLSPGLGRENRALPRYNRATTGSEGWRWRWDRCCGASLNLEGDLAAMGGRKGCEKGPRGNAHEGLLYGGQGKSTLGIQGVQTQLYDAQAGIRRGPEMLLGAGAEALVASSGVMSR